MRVQRFMMGMNFRYLRLLNPEPALGTASRRRTWSMAKELLYLCKKYLEYTEELLARRKERFTYNLDLGCRTTLQAGDGDGDVF